MRSVVAVALGSSRRSFGSGRQGTGVVNLRFAGKSVSGHKPLETDKTGVMGLNVAVSVSAVPEPVTMALLALGGLVARRRR